MSEKAFLRLPLAMKEAIARSRLKKPVKAILRKLGLLDIALRFYGHDPAAPKGAPDELPEPYLPEIAPDGLPVPPRKLIYLVTPAYDAKTFLETGASAVEFMTGLLERHGVRKDALHAILDFGCGCGRVIRHFHALKISGLELYGSDYNPKLVEWCKQNLPIGEFQVNQLAPPLNYRDSQFDFVYALSVFTHLTEPLQFQWIDELSRILKPGGHLLITTHGAGFLEDLSESQREQFLAGQFAARYTDEAGTNNYGAYHPVPYVKEKFAYAFEVIEVFEEHRSKHQDTYLLRKLRKSATATHSAPIPS